jgi:hypothetical protein
VSRKPECGIAGQQERESTGRGEQPTASWGRPCICWELQVPQPGANFRSGLIALFTIFL